MYSTPGRGAAGLFESLKRMTTALSHRGPDDSGALAGIPNPASLSATGAWPSSICLPRAISRCPPQVAAITSLSTAGDPISANCASSSKSRVMAFEVTRTQRFCSWPSKRGACNPLCSVPLACSPWGCGTPRNRCSILCETALREPLYYGWVGECISLCLRTQSVPQTSRLERADQSRRSLPPDETRLYPGSVFNLQGRVQAPAGDHGPGLAPIDAHGDRHGLQVSRPRHLVIQSVAQMGQRNPFRGSDSDAIERLEALSRVVSLSRWLRCRSGLFSPAGRTSTIVALMQAQSARPSENVHDWV